MTSVAALAALLLLAAPAPDQPAEDGPPPAQPAAPAGQAAPTGQPAPTIDSILTQEPPTEDARQAAVRAAFAAAQALRGGLDGRWRLTTAEGEALYIFQFADSGLSADPRSSTPWTPTIEGAWRDPRREGAIDSSGFVSSIERNGMVLVIRLFDRDNRRPTVITLNQQSGGPGWSGALEDGDGHHNVVMSPF